MARYRQPIELVIAKGKTHLTKAAIAERRAQEVQQSTDEVAPPASLTKKQAEHFEKLARQLLKIRILSETDCETLARYVQVEEMYEKTTKHLQQLMRTWDDLYEIEQVSKLQDRYFKQAHTAASALGLTISSRCRLQVPVKEEEEHVNKFSRLREAAGDE